MKEIRDFYRTHGPYTDPGETGLLPDSVPADIKTLVGIVQANMIHAHWLPRYGLEIDPARREREMNLRTFRERLANICANNGTFSVGQHHPNEGKSIGTCRDFTVALTALLREKGIPAREWCGFGTYFTPGKFEDHWICEWWNDKEKRWVLTDGQLDELQRKVLNTGFDPLDMPRDHFIAGGRAWLMARREGFDPDRFGIFEWHGMDFIKGNLIRHAAAFCKVTLLPWDCWGLIETPYTSLTVDDLNILDTLAELLDDPDSGFDRISRIYKTDDRIRMTGSITSYSNGKYLPVTGLAV
jgi:hypothetical protein